MKQVARIFGIFATTLLLGTTSGLTSDLPDCPTSGYLNNCFGTLNYSGDKYTGEFQDNKRHGYGTYIFLTGERYTGYWENDMRNGFGTNIFNTGEKYNGMYKNNLRHGYGVNYFPSGETFEGWYQNDRKTGIGIITFGGDYKGDKYIGYHLNDDMSGQGLYIWDDGRSDLCFYKKNKPSNCSGTNINNVFPALKRSYTALNLKDRKIIQQILNEKGKYNDTIDGKWGKNTLIAIAEFAAIEMATIDLQNTNIVENILTGILQAGLSEEPDLTQNNKTASIASDLPACPTSGYLNNCFGTYTFANGDKYIGEFKNNTYNGQGTFAFANGDKYVGEWKNGAYDGQGTFEFGPNSQSPGDQYVGEFKNNNKDGQGIYTFGPNSQYAGDRYVGEWKNNAYNGQGTYTYNNGDRYAGEFKDDKRNGQGTFAFANGDKYVGEWKNNIYNGQGTYTFGPNSKNAGEQYVGEFKDGSYDGHGTYTYNNGDRYEGEFKNSKRDGRGTIIYADGTKREGDWREDEFIYADQNTPKEPRNKSIADNIDPNEILNAASGTGFYVSNEGHIITNHHVINGCSEIKVHAEGKSTTATILAKDASNDLALLKIPNRPPHVFAFSNENPYPLQNIIVAGFPFGDAVSSSLKFTTGVISSLAGIGNNYSQMQIDAALQPGNSGGPIIDELGNIVGIAVAKLDVDKVYEDFGVIPENTNFGIKGSIAKILLQSFNVPLKAPNTKEIPKSELSTITTKGTLHLSCWMTLAQIEAMQSQKVLFQKFD